MDKYMENESLDTVVGAIVEKELYDYKKRLKNNLLQHLNNPHCAKTDMGNVMYEKEILNIIERTR